MSGIFGLFNTEFTQEFRLLLASGLFPLQVKEIEHLRTCCRPNIDWAAFYALVERHRIFPTVYRNLNTHVPELVPPSTLAELKERVAVNRLRIFNLLAELGRLSQLFEREEIQLCSLKGPLLSQQLFGDPSLRTSSDLDLLIQPEAVAQAEALLLDNGYQRKLPASPLTPRQWQVYRQEWRHINFYLPERRILVELHWALAPPHMVSIKDVHTMLSRARPTALAGSNLYALSEDDLPAYLLIHGSLHSWVRLKWLVDFVVWMRRATIADWDNLQSKMEDLGLQRSLAQGVLLANWLFSSTIPEPVQAFLVDDPLAQDMARHSLEAILNTQYTGEEAGGFQRFKIILYRSKLKKGLRYKWKSLSKIWVIHYDWEDMPLPDALYPLYWLLRPFLWFRRYYLRRQ